MRSEDLVYGQFVLSDPFRTVRCAVPAGCRYACLKGAGQGTGYVLRCGHDRFDARFEMPRGDGCRSERGRGGDGASQRRSERDQKCALRGHGLDAVHEAGAQVPSEIRGDHSGSAACRNDKDVYRIGVCAAAEPDPVYFVRSAYAGARSHLFQTVRLLYG